MVSSIDPTEPDDTELQLSDVRTNFSYAKTEIEALQAFDSNLTNTSI